MGGHVREATAVEIDIGGIIFLRLGAHVLVQVSANGKFLVPRSLEVVTEATGRTNPCDFGVEAHGSAYTGNVGARGLDRKLVSYMGSGRYLMHTGKIGLN